MNGATHIHVSIVNKDEGYIFYDEKEGLDDSYTKGELFRFLRKEYGRCSGHVYIETDGESKKVGWVFENRAKYTDSGDKYLQETWVSPITVTPEVWERVGV